MNRFWAFLIHLGISLVIFAFLAYLVVYVWYPDFFFDSDGGWQGMRIIVLVDLVLGPTLTLIVFNVKKPRRELQRDLAIIASIQFACLAAGVYVVHSERPLALVYVDGRFYSMSADDYTEAGVPVPDLSDFPGSYPKQIAVDLPEDVFELSDIRRTALQERRPLRTLTTRYVPLGADHLNIEKEALSQEWLETRESGTGDVSRWLTRHGGHADDYAFFTFGTRYAFLILGVRRTDGTVMGLLDTPIELVERAEAEEAPEAST